MLNVERRMHALLEQRSATASDKKCTSTKDSEDSAVHLGGEGAGATSAPHVPGLEDNIKRSVPVPTKIDSLPPPNVPVYFTSSVEENPELVKQQIQMEKHLTLPTGLPLNDPSGASDQTLRPGEAPTQQFHEHKNSKSQKKLEREEVKAWYFVGLNFESDSE